MRALGNRTTVLLAAAFALSFNTFNASAASKGKLPTPANFRVAAKTAYTVTLAWDPAPANSGDFNYHLWGAYNVGPTVILPKTATSHGARRCVSKGRDDSTLRLWGEACAGRASCNRRSKDSARCTRAGPSQRDRPYRGPYRGYTPQR